MKYFTCLALFMGSFFATNLQAQNGWTRPAKSFYAQATVSHFSANDYYNTSGTLSNNSTFRSQGLLLYGEYGITNRLTTLLDAPALMLNSFSTTETVAGVGSVKLGLKYRLLKKFPLAIQAEFDIPTDDGVLLSTAKEPNALGFFDQINLPTSDGEFNVWTTLVASQSFNGGKTYASLYGSVNFRTQNFSNQLHIGGELGHLFFNKLYVIGKLKIQEKLNTNNASSGSFLYGEGTTFTAFSLTTMYKVNEHWKIVASYADFTDIIVERKNIYDGGAFSLGVSVEY